MDAIVEMSRLIREVEARARVGSSEGEAAYEADRRTLADRRAAERARDRRAP